MGKPPKPKRNIFVRILLFLIGLAVVLAAVALVAFRDRINADALRRWFAYRSLALNDSGQAESFRYSDSSSDVFADLNGDLLVCSGNTVGLYSGSGTQYINQSVRMSAPAVDTGGNAAVLYDAGGTELYVFRQRALAFSLTGEDTLLCARLNDNGLLTVVSQQSGYRGVVTVYDADFQPSLAVRLNTYIMDAQLSNSGKALALVTIGQTEGDFTSTLLIYDLSALGSDEISYDVSPSFRCSLGSSVILELAQSGGCLWALGDRGLSVLDQQAALLGFQNWADRYLKGYAFSDDGFAVALLGKYRAGSQAELLVVDSDGLASSLPLDEQVLSIDAAGRYFAILTANRLDIYTKDMSLYATLDNTQNARRVLLHEDGSAMLISAGTARLYVPS